MKKLLIASATMLLLVGCTSADQKSMDSKIVDLETQVQAVSASTSELKDEAVVLKNEAMSLEKKVDMLNTKVDAIKSTLAE